MFQNLSSLAPVGSDWIRLVRGLDTWLRQTTQQVSQKAKLSLDFHNGVPYQGHGPHPERGEIGPWPLWPQALVDRLLSAPNRNISVSNEVRNLNSESPDPGAKVGGSGGGQPLGSLEP